MMGADAVSGLFGHGKQPAFKSYVKSQEARQLLLSVGKILADAHALRWQKLKRKSTHRLPPDHDSFYLYVTV